MKTNLHCSPGGHMDYSALRYAKTTGLTDMYPDGFPCEVRFSQPDYHCWHIDCGVAAGIVPSIRLFNHLFRAELHHNWLRFDNHKPEVRSRKAAAYWELKKRFLDTGKFDFYTTALVGILALS